MAPSHMFGKVQERKERKILIENIGKQIFFCSPKLRFIFILLSVQVDTINSITGIRFKN